MSLEPKENIINLIDLNFYNVWLRLNNFSKLMKNRCSELPWHTLTKACWHIFGLEGPLLWYNHILWERGLLYAIVRLPLDRSKLCYEPKANQVYLLRPRFERARRHRRSSYIVYYLWVQGGRWAREVNGCTDESKSETRDVRTSDPYWKSRCGARGWRGCGLESALKSWMKTGLRKRHAEEGRRRSILRDRVRALAQVEGKKWEETSASEVKAFF